MASSPEYQLYYWPGIQGRGEFVRLAFEDAGVDYDDVARRSGPDGGVAALQRLLEGELPGLAPFGPPALRHGDLVVAQTAAILQYVAPRLGLVPADEESRLRAHQIQLTLADLVAETHDVHHPISVSLYYEEQKREAKRRAEAFLRERVPKFLHYLDRALDSNPAGGGRWLVGATCSYVDLSTFQVLAGLRYAFPHAMQRHEQRFPRLGALHQAVAARPRLAAYLASDRRLPFNEHGIFRHYPELDLPARGGRPGTARRRAGRPATAGRAGGKSGKAATPKRSRGGGAGSTSSRASRAGARRPTAKPRSRSR